MYDEINRPTPWRDVSLPGGWYLNSWCMPVSPLPHEGHKRLDKIPRGRFSLPPDLRDDPAYAINTYNWITSGASDFNPHLRAGYLGDVNFFDRKGGKGRDDGEEDKDELHDEEDDGHNDAFFDNTAAPGGVVNQLVQPAELTEDEALKMAIA
jgi:hypothetical protein